MKVDRQRDSKRKMASLLMVSLLCLQPPAVSIAAQNPGSDYPDFKNPQPHKDSHGQIMPDTWDVTVCKGADFTYAINGPEVDVHMHEYSGYGYGPPGRDVTVRQNGNAFVFTGRHETTHRLTILEGDVVPIDGSPSRHVTFYVRVIDCNTPSTTAPPPKTNAAIGNAGTPAQKPGQKPVAGSAGANTPNTATTPNVPSGPAANPPNSSRPAGQPQTNPAATNPAGTNPPAVGSNTGGNNVGSGQPASGQPALPSGGDAQNACPPDCNEDKLVEDLIADEDAEREASSALDAANSNLNSAQAALGAANQGTDATKTESARQAYTAAENAQQVAYKTLQAAAKKREDAQAALDECRAKKAKKNCPPAAPAGGTGGASLGTGGTPAAGAGGGGGNSTGGAAGGNPAGPGAAVGSSGGASTIGGVFNPVTATGGSTGANAVSISPAVYVYQLVITGGSVNGPSAPGVVTAGGTPNNPPNAPGNPAQGCGPNNGGGNNNAGTGNNGGNGNNSGNGNNGGNGSGNDGGGGGRVPQKQKGPVPTLPGFAGRGGNAGGNNVGNTAGNNAGTGAGNNGPAINGVAANASANQMPPGNPGTPTSGGAPNSNIGPLAYTPPPPSEIDRQTASALCEQAQRLRNLATQDSDKSTHATDPQTRDYFAAESIRQENAANQREQLARHYDPNACPPTGSMVATNGSASVEGTGATGNAGTTGTTRPTNAPAAGGAAVATNGAGAATGVGSAVSNLPAEGAAADGANAPAKTAGGATKGAPTAAPTGNSRTTGPVTVAGVTYYPLDPKEVAFNNAFENALAASANAKIPGDLVVSTGGNPAAMAQSASAPNPNDIHFGLPEKEAVVFEQAILLGNLTQAVDAANQLATKLQNMNPAQKEMYIADLRTQASAIMPKYKAYQDLKTKVDAVPGGVAALRDNYNLLKNNPLLSGAAGGIANVDGSYQSDYAQRSNDYMLYRDFLSAESAYYQSLAENPLQAVQAEVDSPHFFEVILNNATVEMTGPENLLTQYVTLERNQLKEQFDRINGFQGGAYWELASPQYAQIQAVAATYGPLATKLMAGVQAQYEGTQAVTAANRAEHDLVLAVGSAVPFFGIPVMALQVAEAGSDYSAAGRNLQNAQQLAPVIGYQAVIDASEAREAAGSNLTKTAVLNTVFIGLQVVPGGVRLYRTLGGRTAGSEAAAAAEDAKAGALVADANAGGNATAVAADTKAVTAEATLAKGEGGAEKSGFMPGREISADPVAQQAQLNQFLEHQRATTGVQEVEAELRLAAQAGVPADEVAEIVKYYNPTGNPSGNLQIAHELMVTRLKHLGVDVAMAPEEFNQIQALSTRAGPKGAGLTTQDVTWLQGKIDADPNYLNKLTARGYVTDFGRANFSRKIQLPNGEIIDQFGGINVRAPQEGFVSALQDTEDVQALKDAFVKAGGKLPPGGAAIPGKPAAPSIPEVSSATTETPTGEPVARGSMPATSATPAWDLAKTQSPQLQAFEQFVVSGKDVPLNQVRDVVMSLKTDPAAMRSLKNAPANVRQAFNQIEGSIYRVHDQAVINHVEGITTLKNGQPAPWVGKTIKVDDFRTPGANGQVDPLSINTDRDYRVLYQNEKGQWIEVPRQYWQNFSTEQFANASGYTPDKLRQIASPADLKVWQNWNPAEHNGQTLDQAMKEKWQELHQQLATDKYHPEASIDFSDQARIQGELSQVGQNIKDVKQGQAVLQDAERLGMMYNEKADAYLRLDSAMNPGGNKLEAAAQLNKGIGMLDDVRKGYQQLYGGFGQNAPIGKLSPRFQKAADAIKSLAPFDKTITPEQITQVENQLKELGFGTGANPGNPLKDFKEALDAQFQSLKTVPGPIGPPPPPPQVMPPRSSMILPRNPDLSIPLEHGEGPRFRLANWTGSTGGRFQAAAFHTVVASPELPPGTIVRLVPSEAPPAAASDEVSFSIVANGKSSGQAFELQVIDPTGKVRQIAMPEGVVLQPLRAATTKSAEVRTVGNLLTRPLTAYCLDFAKLPPEPGMLYRIAPQALQDKFKPIRSVLRAGRELAENGLLHPDSDPEEYANDIRQYALWSKLENWGEQKFMEMFLEHTKKNAQAMKVKWTKQMEQAVLGLAPGRWRDVSMVLEEAEKLSKGSPRPDSQ
jgi:hypothetical protein